MRATKIVVPERISTKDSNTNRYLPVKRILPIVLFLAALFLSACSSTTLTSLPESPKQEAAIPADKVDLPAEVPSTQAKADLPQIIKFTSNLYNIPSPQKIRLDFQTSENITALELSYNRQIVNVKGKTSLEVEISQSTTFNLHALNSAGRQSSSLSVRVGNSPFILQPQDVLRLRAADGNRQLALGTNVPEGYELVVMGISEIDNSKKQSLSLSQLQGLKADTKQQELSTLALTETASDLTQNTTSQIDGSSTALILNDNLATQNLLQTQALQVTTCSYIVGSVCNFFVLAFDTKVNQTYLDIRSFKLMSNIDGMNFFVDEADLVQTNPDIDPISKDTIGHMGKCTSTVFKRHFNKSFASKTDIDNSGGVSFLISNVLPYNGMVRWDDFDQTATGENNRADVAYLNTEHMRNLSPLSLATLYEEMFHAHHLGYRAASGLVRPDRFEAESVIGAVLHNIRQDAGISATCGGSAKDVANSIELAAGHFTLANIFLNKSYKRSLFSKETVSLQMAQYGIGRLLASTISHRDKQFINKVISSKNTYHKTWSSLTDSTRVFEDAWLSLFLADSPDHAGYNLAKSHYTRLDTDYNILATVKGLSLDSIGVGQSGFSHTNESLIMLTGQANQASEVVNLSLDFDSGSVVAFLRLKK